MIVQWLLGIASGIVGWASSLLPRGDPPSFIASVGGTLAGVVTSAQGLSAFVPWAFVLGTVTVVLGVWVVCAGIKAVRWLLAWIPTWGGS